MPNPVSSQGGELCSPLPRFGQHGSEDNLKSWVAEPPLTWPTDWWGVSFGHTNFRMSRWQKTAHIDGDGVLPRYPYYMMYGEQVDQLATLVVATSCRHTLRESIIIYSLVSIMYII